ncbi:hypothetical protein MMC29_001255 [Sticta canariensis]|nr:hypothetical protein [Sticta canariensis]
MVGTKVTYNGEERDRLSSIDWPLVGPSIITNGKPPILNITDRVQFKVVVPHRSITSPEYIDEVKKFRMGTGDPENLGQQTPSTGSRSRQILYMTKFGEGAYGVVTYVWDLTTREEYVVKRPLRKLIKSGKVDLKSWRIEAEIMRTISHKHTVAFRDATYTNLSTLVSTHILCQSSSALEYLHNQNPSIAHRDIKPENILVVERGTDGIYVKFADFGLFKAADTLKTFRGTLLWAAPEIYLKAADPIGAAKDTYSVAVDIWSLGVFVASLECGGLPVYEAGMY